MTDQPTPHPDDESRVSRLISNGSNGSNGDDIVREYEMRYEPRHSRTMPRSYSTMRVSDDERVWAAIAHSSIWITMLGGLFTGGFVVPLSIFIPLVIYFMYRKQSDYVAFHALQAFMLQLIGTVGVLALTIVGGTVWVIGLVIALLAVVVLVGIILVPLWGIVGILLGMAISIMPLVALLFGTIAAIETYNRRDYRYPLVARWVDRQLARGLVNTV